MIRIICLVILGYLANSKTAVAQPTAYYKQFWSSPDYSLFQSSGTIAIGVIDSQIKGYRSHVSPASGYLIAGVAGGAKIDMNGVGGSAVGVYGVAEGAGRPGGVQNEVVGMYGRADKNGPYWATGVHGECLTEKVDSGGSCIGLNSELIGANPKTLMIGVNIQPRPEVRNAIGLQIQDNPTTSYQYSIKAPNMAVQFGDVDTDHFCMRFDPRTQRLEFWRACNRPHSTRVGYVDMNFGAPDVPLNR